MFLLEGGDVEVVEGFEERVGGVLVFGVGVEDVDVDWGWGWDWDCRDGVVEAALVRFGAIVGVSRMWRWDRWW